MFGLRLLTKVIDVDRPHVSPHRCVRKFKRATCQLCLEHCPQKAIQLADPLRMDDTRCNGCGVCTNVCPTGAFASSSTARLVYPIEPGDGSLSCSLGPDAPGGLGAVSCLGSLGAGVLIAAAARRRVSLDTSHCQKCENGSALAVIDKTAAVANSILQALGSKSSITLENIGSEHQAVALRSRRELFSYLRGHAVRMAAETANEVLDKTFPSLLPPEGTVGCIPLKHQLLRRQLATLSASSTEDRADASIPLGSPGRPDRCEGCSICAVACPTGALYVSEDDSAWRLLFELGNCVDCRACAEVCPIASLPYNSSGPLASRISAVPEVLVNASKRDCSDCGRSFASPQGDTICPSCQKKS